MLRMFKQAIKEYGTTDEGGRWLLPDGQLLAIFGGDDHRIVGQFCENSWLEFIANGAWSLHRSRDYLWVRHNDKFNVYVQQKFQELYDTWGWNINELYVQIYDGLRHVESFSLDDPHLIKLYLTDRIAYQMVINDMEDWG